MPALDVAKRRLVLRSRLIRDVLAVPDVALIEAGGGFGKTVLTDQLAESAGPESLAVRLPRREPVSSDELKAQVLDAKEVDPVSNRPRVSYDGDLAVSDLTGPDEVSALLLVDNAQSLTDEAAGWLAGFVDECAPTVRSVMSGRVVPGPLAALELTGTATRFDTDDLRLTPEESRALVQLELADEDAERLWSALHRFSGGWITLLLLVLRRLVHSRDRLGAAAELLRQPALLGQLIDYYASELSEVDRELFIQLAHFPMVTERIVDALGAAGLLRRLSQAGIPFVVGTDGWSRLPTTVREHVAGLTPLDPEIAKRAAPLFVAQGAELTAARLLADSEDHDAAARLLSRLPTSRIDALDPAGFMHLVARLGVAADVAPRVLLQLARIHGNIGQLDEEREVIGRALRAVGEDVGREHDLATEVEAEHLFQRALVNDTGALDRIEVVLDEATPGSRAQARLLEALGVGLSDLPHEAALRRAENAMRQAAITWHELDEPSRAASVQRGLAVRVLAALGKLGAGASLLEKLAVASETPYDRMLCHVFEARLLALAGEGERADAVLVEAGSLAELLGIEWVLGHIAWTRLLVAANDGAGQRVLEQLALAEAHLGQLLNDAGGLLFLCESADACASVGARSQAARLLATAQPRRAEDPSVVALTEAYLSARFGADAAGLLDSLLREEQVAPGLGWKVELLRGLAQMNHGDLDAAGRSLQEALNSAARLGHPDLPDQRERPVVDALRSAAITASEGVSQLRRDDEYEVAVLGRFEVRRGGEVLAPRPGRATAVVKYVALAGGIAPIEAVVEALWPDEMPGIGQRRLKNVLSRIRASYGPLMVRDGQHLRLADCDIDLSRFEQKLTEVAARRGHERVAKAREALDEYPGPLLPDDLYDDHINQRREAVRRKVLGLVDVVLAADLAEGDLDDAVGRLHAAMEHDPYDQERPLRVARALVESERDLEARGLVEQVVATADELGMPTAVEWQELIQH
jgi:DNA-binding SARP family transcriptional activator